MKNIAYLSLLIALLTTHAPAHADSVYVDRQTNKDKNDLISDEELLPNDELIPNKKPIGQRDDNDNDPVVIIEDENNDGVIELDGNVRVIAGDEPVYSTNSNAISRDEEPNDEDISDYRKDNYQDGGRSPHLKHHSDTEYGKQ